MKAQLEKLLTQANAKYEKDHAAYTKLSKEREALDKKRLAAKEVAGKSANAVAALKKTLAGME